MNLQEGADLSSDSDKTSYLKDEDYKLNEETKPKIIYADEVAELKRGKRQLINRCKVLSGGKRCLWCGFRKECNEKEEDE